LLLIALTGLRREEACGLRWREVDEAGQCLRLEGTKTGRSTRPIGKPALELLRAQPREEGVEWVFPRADRRASAEFKKMFGALFDAAGYRCALARSARVRNIARPMKGSAMQRSPNCSAMPGAVSRRDTISADPIRPWSRLPTRWQSESRQHWTSGTCRPVLAKGAGA
jgi:hypothetical protein